MTADALDMIAQLVAFDTVSRRSNLALIHFVQEFLSRHGVQSQLIFNAAGDKANLLATIGPNVAGGVVLSGHTDVVPVDGQPWSSDPFTLRQEGGRLYGRGTADMKSFIAVILAAVPALVARGLKRPIHLALSYDEEIGCLGAPALIEHLRDAIAPPLAVIVGEPSRMQPVVAHKGIAALRTTVYGHEAHSSQVEQGVSAVMTGARLVRFIDDMMAQNRAQADPACRFAPPWTTLHVGTLDGGTAVNIIARECRFDWDIRTLPGDDWRRYHARFERHAATLTPAMQAIAPSAAIHTALLAEVPPLQERPGPALDLVCALLEQSDTAVVPFVAEAGQYQQAGFSVVICGPGAIDQAHQPDEFIDIAQVTACERFIARLADQLSQ